MARGSGRGRRCRRSNVCSFDRRRGNMKAHLILSLAVATAVVVAAHAPAAELKIFGSRVTRRVVGDLGPGFEQATGNKLTVLTDVAAVMKRRIEQGEPFDLA